MQHDIMLEIRVEAIKKILYTKLKSYDLILSIGQVVPHEVVGMGHFREREKQMNGPGSR